MMMALTATVLPLPVEPAIRICGILVRSEISGAPVVDLPSTSGRAHLRDLNSRHSIISRKLTVLEIELGTSMPIADLPGMGMIRRMLWAFSAKARSSDKEAIELTLTPGA